MASSSTLSALFLRARDLDLAAARRLAAAVVLLGLFHLAVFTPFVETSRRRASASSGLAGLDGVASGLGELGAQLTRAHAVVDEVMRPALDGLVEDLDGDLARLRATHQSLREFLAAQSGARAPAPPAEEGAEPYLVENIDRILAVGEASTRRELVAALAPVVEEHVVGPRFGDLRQLWTASVVPRVEASLDGVAGSVLELRRRFAEAVATVAARPAESTAAWEALGTALAAERRAVRDLTWEPPERADWWTSAEAAEGELASLRLDPAVAEQLRQPLALDQFQATVTRTSAAYEDLLGVVERRRGGLVHELESGGLPSALRGSGATKTVRGFPLVLGLVLALALTVWTRRRRELGLLTYLLLMSGEAGELREWYYIRPRWGMSGVEVRATAWRSAWRRAFVLALLALAWIGFAAFRLWGMEPAGHLLTLAGLGAAALLLAVTYSLAVTRSLHALLGGTPVLPATYDREPAADDDDVLDAHTLHR